MLKTDQGRYSVLIIFIGKIKGGYLTVPEGKLFTSWKSRWVVLEGDTLYVFNSEADEPNKVCNAILVLTTTTTTAAAKSTTNPAYWR